MLKGIGRLRRWKLLQFWLHSFCVDKQGYFAYFAYFCVGNHGYFAYLSVFGWAIMDTMNTSDVSTFITDVKAFLVSFVFLTWKQPAQGRMKKIFCFNSWKRGQHAKVHVKKLESCLKSLISITCTSCTTCMGGRENELEHYVLSIFFANSFDILQMYKWYVLNSKLVKS